jgi:tetratricopeptide (TPR) repeat protein
MSLWQTYQKDEAIEARRLFERAMELDPNFALGFVGYAVTYVQGVRLGFFDRDDHEKALQAARRAVALDDEDAWTHSALGTVHFANQDHDAAVAELEYAIQLNPSFVTAHYYLGRSLTCCGKGEAAIPHIEQAIRLSPRDPLSGHFHVGMARAYLCLRQHEKAVEAVKRGLRHQNLHWTAPATLASALGHLGRQDEARRAVKDIERLRPGTTVGFVRERLPITNLDDMNHLLEGLRKAGLPE